MLKVEQIKHSQIERDRPKHNIIKYLEWNKISAEGCLHLRKAQWPKLQIISLCKYHIEYLVENEIGDEGCSHLSKAHWPNLQTINLSKYFQYLDVNNINA